MKRTKLSARAVLFAIGILSACTGGTGAPTSGAGGSQERDTDSGGEQGTEAGGDAGSSSSMGGTGATFSSTGGTVAQGGSPTGATGGVVGGTPGNTGGRGGTPDTNELPAPGYVPAIVAVGYGGIRLLSRDRGLTWIKTGQFTVGGGDDPNLLVGIAWGRGLWVSTFFKFLTSPDGLNWTERALPVFGCNLLARVAYGNGIFVSNCNDDRNTTFVSQDGLTWKRGGTINSGGHTDLQFAAVDGKFVASSADAHRVFTSVDGITWTQMPGLTDASVCDGVVKSIAACGNAFRGIPGVWLRSEWQNRITRSTNGTAFTGVYTDDGRNGVANFAAGWAPAP